MKITTDSRADITSVEVRHAYGDDVIIDIRNGYQSLLYIIISNDELDMVASAVAAYRANADDAPEVTANAEGVKVTTTKTTIVEV